MTTNQVDKAVTTDDFLGGRVKVLQPVDGYRAGSDTVLLAACVAAQPHHRVLEVGTGVGTALCCLGVRLPLCHLVGLEKQPDLVRLARQNAQINTLGDRLTILEGDIMEGLSSLQPNHFDHVFSNPPYFEAKKATPSPSKAVSRVESTAVLLDWIDFCLRFLKPKGTLTLIYPADRLQEVLSIIGTRVGSLVIFPLWPREGVAAKRVLIQGCKGSKGRLTLSAGLVLHHPDGSYTPQAQSILREGAPLLLTP